MTDGWRWSALEQGFPGAVAHAEVYLDVDLEVLGGELARVVEMVIHGEPEHVEYRLAIARNLLGLLAERRLPAPTDQAQGT